jgi:hypothetical protein
MQPRFLPEQVLAHERGGGRLGQGPDGSGQIQRRPARSEGGRPIPAAARGQRPEREAAEASARDRRRVCKKKVSLPLRLLY